MNQCGSVRCKKRSRRLLRCWQGKAVSSPMGIDGHHPNNGEAFRKFPRFLECFLKDAETNCEGAGEKTHPRNCERNRWFCTGFTFNSIPEFLPPQRYPHGWVIQQCAAQVESKMLRCYRSSVDCRLGMHIYREGITEMGQLQTAKQWDIPPKDRYCSICSAHFRYKMVQARLRFWLQGGYYNPGLCAVCASSRLSPGYDRFGKRQQKDICLRNLLARTNSPCFFLHGGIIKAGLQWGVGKTCNFSTFGHFCISVFLAAFSASDSASRLVDFWAVLWSSKSLS